MQANSISLASREVRTPKALAEFVKAMSGPLSRIQESLALGTALTCKQEHWMDPAVQIVIEETPFPNEVLGIVFRLLASSSMDEGKRCQLQMLFRRKHSRLLKGRILAHLLWTLHFRKLLDAGEVLLPQLRWYKSAAVWENGLLALRICCPSAAPNDRLRHTAKWKSSHCRLFMQVACSDTTDLAAPEFQKSIAELSRQDDRAHLKMLLDLSWVCGYDDGVLLASAVVRELIRHGDYRNIELLTPFVAESRREEDRKVLALLAKGPNPMAAQWAKRVIDSA